MLLSLYCIGSQAGTGTIRGKVFDKSNAGAPMYGADVTLEDTYYGEMTEVDGSYSMEDIPEGTYTLLVNFITYREIRVENVVVKAGEVLVLNFEMEFEAVDLGPVTIEAKKVTNSEQALLTQRKEAEGIQDNISGKELSKFGVSDAATAMSKVTGASVLDGKYVSVRGLSDRYSGAQLNGNALTSTDPYRNSSALDLIPSNLIDNITTSKSFTPDQPGTFTGGNVIINTKTFPEKFTVSASLGIGVNTNTTFKERLVHEGGSLDWLGYDNGTRALPTILEDTSMTNMLTRGFYITARSDDDLAAFLNEASNAVNRQMAGTVANSTPMDQSLSFAIGNRTKLFGKTFGYSAGIHYKRSFSGYQDGMIGGYELVDSGAETLGENFAFIDRKGVEAPQFGGLLNLGYKFNSANQIGLNYIYNHDAEIETRYQYGSFPAVIAGSNTTFETRTLHFTERSINNVQLNGKHQLDSARGIKMNWIIGYTMSDQKEPDLRFFANTFDPSGYYITPSEYDLPYHFWRELKDDKYEGKVDFNIPILQRKNLPDSLRGHYKSNKLKIGGMYSSKHREFNERRFQMLSRPEAVNYAGDPVAFFAEDNTGKIGYDTARSRHIFGNYLTDGTDPRNDYSGDEVIYAGYAMINVKLTSNLKFVGGVRIEGTQITVNSGDTSLPTGSIDTIDFLPSVNLIYQLGEKTNLRASFTQTIARPNMRELAPFASFDFIGGALILGNPELEKTSINNFDLRIETFPNRGEIYAFSAYYKQFSNPIIQAYNPKASNPQIDFINVPKASVYGFELEMRKNLGSLATWLDPFKIGMNASYIFSEVDIPSAELAIIQERNPEFGNTRPFAGQSPWLLNGHMSYTHDSIGLEITLAYNYYADRLAAVSTSGTPDIYEKGRGVLDLVVTQQLTDRFSAKLSAKNLLNSEFSQIMTYNNTEYVIQSYSKGRNFGLSFSYKIN